MAGDHGRGDALNQLHLPFGLGIDKDGSFFIADINNHRLVQWKPSAAQGELVAGGKEQGNGTDQLDQPLSVLIDRMNDCMFVSDFGNRQVMRWFLQNDKQTEGKGEVILSDTSLLGLAMDDEGALYVSDIEKHQVRR